LCREESDPEAELSRRKNLSQRHTDRAQDERADPVSTENFPDEFPPDKFAIVAFCDVCGHSARLPRLRIPEGVTIQALPSRLRCSKCGKRAGSIRIVYTGGGSFRHSGTQVIAS
jgi:hypothetical protein